MIKLQRFNRLPHLKQWLPLSIVATLLALGAGFLGTNAGVLAAEFEIDQRLNRMGGHTLPTIAKLASLVYSPKYAVILTLVMVVLIWLVGKSLFDGLAFALTVAFGWLPAEFFKIMFNEPRPDVTKLSHLVLAQETDTAYPSGHVCFALAFGFALFYLLRQTKAKWFAVAFWAVSVLVEAWARLYVGAHYLNDVLGSLCTTFVGVMVFAFLWNKYVSERLQETKFFHLN